MSRIERNPIYDESYILVGLRYLSDQIFIIPQYYEFKHLFERSLTNDKRAKHRFTTKEFCFKIALSILTNKRLEITSKDQLRITEQNIYEPNSTEFYQIKNSILRNTKLSDEDITVLTGLKIFDNDHEIEKYLTGIEPWEYHCLCNTCIHAYSNVFTIWDLCKTLGIAYKSNKKIAIDTVIYRDRTDSAHLEIKLI